MTKGTVRDVAHGVALGAACIAVYDFVSEVLRDEPDKKSAPKKPPEPRNQQAPEPPVAAPAQPVAAPAASDDLTPQELAQLQAIAENLTPEEREALARVEQKSDPAVAKKLKRTLLRMTRDQAIAFLRQNLLPHAKGAQSHEPRG
jgi:hypothetical protein